ncbi:MAG: UDP-3-O-acyl-N-acetylglucosamine deacetylase [Veillonellaceae bacterium]|nr:UDP-3-O-acyl-N-acetylglucosamine deacetylase [Veillonellaceae bacterium]
MSEKQRSIKESVQYEGIGLHSGRPVRMILKPAPANTGIVFVRTDLSGRPSVKAAIENVTSTMRATTLEKGAAKVSTVEHLLAAFYGMRIDNCIVELNFQEPPVGDGSAAVFVDLMKQAGIVELEAERTICYIKQSHAIYDNEGQRFILILPYDGLRLTYTSINSHPMLGKQFEDFIVTDKVFEEDISRARTIGFMKEIEQLQAMGLAKGGNLENCIVYDDTTCLSKLRFDDELVRHKMLDILGDLFLLGPIRGHIIALNSSHELNSRLSRDIRKELGEI